MVITNEIHAKQLVDRFVRRFDESYRSLLYHASLPLVLTPELLNYIRNYFVKEVPWVAEVDLLLSDLCHKVGYELYAIDTSVRAYSLDEMRKEFGQERMQQVASLLIKYLNYLSRNNSFMSYLELRSQRWAALVYLDNENKREVAEDIKGLFLNYNKSLNSIEPNLSIINQNELYQLSLITKELAPQLDRYPEIIQCAKEIHKILTSSSNIDSNQISQHLSKLEVNNGTIIKPFPTKIFEFITAKVDAKGEIIKRDKKQAKQYIENLGNGVQLEMVEIPGGTFMMGSPSSEANRYKDEAPQHKVTIPAFYMGKYQVTQAHWQEIMWNNPSHFKRNDKLPVEQVNWNETIEFCRKLSKKTGNKYRLPSEAEWEYACRAGTTTPFAFGETITPEIVNYKGTYPYGEAPKGEYRRKIISVGSLGVANEFGLYDMHGNVWEWCQDTWHDNYIDAPVDSNTREILLSDNTNRILRGGAYDSDANDCRSANRGVNTPDFRSLSVGFRVVMFCTDS